MDSCASWARMTAGAMCSRAWRMGSRSRSPFALLLALLEYLIGVPIGAMLGFFGGRFDILAQRLIEIWATVPFLFLVIIVASIVRPNFALLLLLLALFTWVGITVLIRAEFYREKAKDYVAAAVAIGVPRWKIMFKHILPNSLVPIITYFPFSVVAGIGALVSLDFLGFGLPPPTPSWGEMMSVGLQHLATGKWWLMLSPMAALFVTLTLIVFIGESVREAFDPRTFSRLR
jgi:microcin C transport system permease protein